MKNKVTKYVIILAILVNLLILSVAILACIPFKKRINLNDITVMIIDEEGYSPTLILRSNTEEQLSNPYCSTCLVDLRYAKIVTGNKELILTKYNFYNLLPMQPPLKSTWPVAIPSSFVRPGHKTNLYIWDGNSYKKFGQILLNNHQKLHFTRHAP